MDYCEYATKNSPCPTRKTNMALQNRDTNYGSVAFMSLNDTYCAKCGQGCPTKSFLIDKGMKPIGN
jgi:hypothetical protein